ncbi:unnamed protein product [Microthlaspi erraticum]|uniref:Reverse transcriptase domain-containing protein n=1 Tax=Microthlaspi erraticum TaxID=1685480 RepID=A0A6D2JTC3_9BRAS|nr:unnamed protein product [Microthlaspi erraticum]
MVGESVERIVLDFFETGQLPEGMNDALVVLIPKVEKPEQVTQFRPISLCNVLFKTITKAMVTRLKSIMPKLIGLAQSSFIPGRLSVDNIVVVQEAVHSMRRKKGKKGWMLLKLDLEKAYDRIRWDFLEDTLRVARFPDKWVNWIMRCVVGPSMHVLWNGRWKPIRLSRGGPQLSHICFADYLILFAEASVGQIRVIRRVLETFCIASGQKVSLDKSKIFFSENVSRNMERLITDESGIKATREVGKYLGMSILQKRINKDTFGETLGRVLSRLAGWKGCCLSFAGQLTLIRSVLSSVPVHTMSTISLPKSTLNSLDKASRSFLWGSTTEQRKLHLLSWRKVCQPKRAGGLGIRLSSDMNKALLAKIGWRLLHNVDSLWARVLRSKYKVKEPHDQSWLVTKGTWSSTWRSVALGLREIVMPGLSWIVGDGKHVKFWMNRWLVEKPLREVALLPLANETEEVRVCDLWRNGTGWLVEQLESLLTSSVILQLQSVVIDNVTGAKDRISWGERPDGRFTVGSAHAFFTRDNTPRQDLGAVFTRVWRVVVPERVRTFIWLGVHQVLMTNSERQRRHLSTSGVCQVCRGGDETILHVLRDCPAMEGIWRRIVPVRKRDRVQFVKDQTREATAAHQSVNINSRTRATWIERLVHWVRPSAGWVKVNTDGASRGNSGLASAGGVLRDELGCWCRGFALNIGICTAPLAELWGVYYGLCIAWDSKAQRVELEVDSEMVVGFLRTGIEEVHSLSFLVRLCHGFLSRDWIVRVSHVYREANRLADGLANYAFSLPSGFHSFTSVPDDVHPLFLEDSVGTGISRQVHL